MPTGAPSVGGSFLLGRDVDSLFPLKKSEERVEATPTGSH